MQIYWIFVSGHRAPHLLCCRALEVQKVVCAPDSLHLRHSTLTIKWFETQRNLQPCERLDKHRRVGQGNRKDRESAGDKGRH